VPATARRRRPRHGAGAEAQEALTLRIHGLDGAVEQLHQRFDAWEAEGAFADSLDHFGRQVLRLAVHEWLANLVQHASFGRRKPAVALAVSLRDDGVQCEVEDNSAGFDFDRQLATQEQIVGGGRASERGRGLLMLIAITDDLAYTSGGGRQRLAFRVRPGAPAGTRALFSVPKEH